MRRVFHVDLDQFIAAVEVQRRPELRGKPVVVGGDGDPTKRGVVSTASYEARRFGVRSGMALRTAYKRCPEAVFLPVDAEAYLAVSREVMEALRSLPATVEVAGWDEAFMALETDDPEAVARRIQQSVFERTGLRSSVGIGDNKLRAKIATGFGKPGGVFHLDRTNWHQVMDARPTEALWGIGTKTARKLGALGIATVGDLAGADEEALARAFGPSTGPWIRRLATGEGPSEVSAEPWVARSHGIERTYQVDVGDPAEVRRRVQALSRELSERLAGEERQVIRIVVKVRFAPFITKTRSHMTDGPTRDPEEIERAAVAALAKLELERPVRLLGVKAEFERSVG